MIKEVEPVELTGERRYLCRCECGRESAVRVQKLLSGLSTSCGKCGALSLKKINRETPLITNKSGFTGVHWNKKDCRWEANLTYHGKRKYLGQYINKGDAIKAREAAVTALEREIKNEKEGEK